LQQRENNSNSAAAETDEEWASLSAANGWATPRDAFDAKLSLPKRATAAEAREALGGHIRALRAAGRASQAHAARSLEGASRARAESDALREELAAASALAGEALAEAERGAAEAAQTRERMQQLVDEEARKASLARAAQAEAGSKAVEASEQASLARAEQRKAEEAARAALAARSKAEERAAAAEAAAKSDAERATKAEAEALAGRAEASAARQLADERGSAAAAAHASASASAAAADRLQSLVDSLARERDAAAAEASKERDARAALAMSLSEASGGGRAAQADAEAARSAAAAAASRAEAAQGDAAAARGEAARASAEASAARAEADRLRREVDVERQRASEAVTAAAAAQQAAAKAAEDALTRGAGAEGDLAAALAAARASARAAERLADDKAAEAEAASGAAEELGREAARLRERLRAAEEVRRRLQNEVLELKGNIRVFARVRPPAPAPVAAEGPGRTGDGRSKQPVVVFVPENAEDTEGGAGMKQTLRLAKPPSSTSGAASSTSTAAATASAHAASDFYSFSFDRVLGPASTQADVFAEVAPLCQSAADGYRVAVLAYGATGSGKTHTMLGEIAAGPSSSTSLTPSSKALEISENAGLAPRAVAALFAAIHKAEEERGWEYEVTAQMVEVVDDELKCLLGGVAPPGKKLSVVHAPEAPPPSTASSSTRLPPRQMHTTVSFAKEVPLRSPADAASLLARASAARAAAATRCNAASSRSHAVFTLALRGRHAASGQALCGSLSLVDLAGSERLDRSGAVGERAREAAAINKSLSALGDVIAALGNASSSSASSGGASGAAAASRPSASSGAAAPAQHIPYRNSKLTWLLRDALGGGGKALLLLAVAPEADAAPETLCSLRFGAKANATHVGTARRALVAASAGSGGGGGGAAAGAGGSGIARR
jgi:kinesin family protein C1